MISRVNRQKKKKELYLPVNKIEDFFDKFKTLKEKKILKMTKIK